ncbi:rho GTPase-activating protein 20-like [Arvicanthis niloticus]|uniref:rho GTPase-activating protein 20-like n=1 Tax=Arvicanthis niloticus TaxID=61156 RepID=UPI001486C7F0|nr:rho GTPase-activating protein 20-like [Arvicanthis niloticus]
MGGLHRSLLCQGPVEITSYNKRKKRYLSLFNDVLVVSSNLNKKKFKIKCIIPLKNLWAVDDVTLYRGNKDYSSKTLFLLWPTEKFFATFRSKEQKDQWYYFLKRSINKAKKGIKKTFSLQIFTENVPTCDSPLCVSATTIDTVNDIMKKLLPMIRVPYIEDYQLWFCPGQWEAPRILQGHECPHDIILTNLQNNLSRLNSRIFPAFPALPGLLGNDIYLDAQGQFILKPTLTYSAESQQQNTKKRHDKKQRTSITSYFHSGSVPQLYQVCTVPRVNKSGQLFGKELNFICKDGKLPAAIVDILSLIRSKGPNTKSIFFISPNETLCKTLKEKLDSGEEVDIKHQSVHVAAWILKEFLRSIKGSLLTSQLYDQWLCVLQRVNEKEKIAAVQSLLERLPQPNAAILVQLFKILYKISRNSSVNQMTSNNLSVEIAPYIFCLRSSHNKDLTNDIAEKISLVNFMIQNTPEIFGVDKGTVWNKTSFVLTYEAKATCSQEIPSDTGNMKEPENRLGSCPSGSTCTSAHYELSKIQSAPLVSEDIKDSEKLHENVSATQMEPFQNPPSQVKNQLVRKFPTIVCLDRMLLATIPDFIRNIQGNVLSSDSYENWISIPDENSVLAKNSAIQREKLFAENVRGSDFSFWEQSPHCDPGIGTTSERSLMLKDTLELHSSGVGDTLNYFRKDWKGREMTFRQVMIDNNVEVLEVDDCTIGNDVQKASDDIKMSLNTAGWDNGKTSTYNVSQRNYFIQIVSLTVFILCCALIYNIYLL